MRCLVFGNNTASALPDSDGKETTYEQHDSRFDQGGCWPESHRSPAHDRHRSGGSLEPALLSECRGRDPREKPPPEYSAQLHATFRGPRSCSDRDRSRSEGLETFREAA